MDEVYDNLKFHHVTWIEAVDHYYVIFHIRQVRVDMSIVDQEGFYII